MHEKRREHVEFGMIGDGNLLLERLIFALDWRATILFVREIEREKKRLRQQEREEEEKKSLAEHWHARNVEMGRPRKQDIFRHYRLYFHDKMIFDELNRRQELIIRQGNYRPIISDGRAGPCLADDLAAEIDELNPPERQQKSSFSSVSKAYTRYNRIRKSTGNIS